MEVGSPRHVTHRGQSIGPVFSLTANRTRINGRLDCFARVDWCSLADIRGLTMKSSYVLQRIIVGCIIALVMFLLRGAIRGHL
jgi:hypothetical protein